MLGNLVGKTNIETGQRLSHLGKLASQGAANDRDV
jgi:hypothetical protein